MSNKKPITLYPQYDFRGDSLIREIWSLLGGGVARQAVFCRALTLGLYELASRHQLPREVEKVFETHNIDAEFHWGDNKGFLPTSPHVAAPAPSAPPMMPLAPQPAPSAPSMAPPAPPPAPPTPSAYPAPPTFFPTPSAPPMMPSAPRPAPSVPPMAPPAPPPAPPAAPSVQFPAPSAPPPVPVTIPQVTLPQVTLPQVTPRDWPPPSQDNQTHGKPPQMATPSVDGSKLLEMLISGEPGAGNLQKGNQEEGDPALGSPKNGNPPNGDLKEGGPKMGLPENGKPEVRRTFVPGGGLLARSEAIQRKLGKLM